MRLVFFVTLVFCTCLILHRLSRHTSSTMKVVELTCQNNINDNMYFRQRLISPFLDDFGEESRNRISLS